MNGLMVALGVLVLAPVAAMRLVVLAPTRLGWVFYGANLLGEFAVKKVGLRRFQAEVGVAAVGVALMGMGAGATTALTAALAMTLLELSVRLAERRLLVTTWASVDGIGPAPAGATAARGLARGYPTPSMHPDLVVNLVGPFVARSPGYRLGALVVGRRLEVELLLGNHSAVPTQTGVRVIVRNPEGLRLDGDSERVTGPIPSGECLRVPLEWVVTHERGAGRVEIEVQWGDRRCTINVGFERCARFDRAAVVSAAVSRYPGGCRAAFAWRGDMDQYDTSTLQSVEGLEVTLRLAARYRMPQTMYLSTRLSLDLAAARAWGEHFGVDRGSREIPRFIHWMREYVDLRHRAPYPFESPKPFVLELGNHGHLHFGTDTSAAAENGWKVRAKMGAGVYPWLGDDRSSFGEQRDNALEARRWCEELFGFSPRSWAMPDRTRDEHTARAMEAAGCEVLSDSDIRTIHNVLLQPPPHLPPGCGAVELTKRYPGDPEHLFHVAMNIFWMHRAHRLGIPMIFMCHQHMRQFDSHACGRFTEAVIRHALTSFNGDLWIDTVYGIGVYWRDVLSAEARRVEARVADGVVRVVSRAPLEYPRVPVDVRFSDGGTATYLVDVPAGATVEVPVA